MGIRQAIDIVTPETFSSQINPAAKIVTLERQMRTLSGQLAIQANTLTGVQHALGLAFKRIEALEAAITQPNPSVKTKKRK